MNNSLTKKNGRFGSCRNFSLASPNSMNLNEANPILDHKQEVGLCLVFPPLFKEPQNMISFGSQAQTRSNFT